MTTIDKYEATVLMHSIRMERDERTPELVDRLARYVGRTLAYDYDISVQRMAEVECKIAEVLEGMCDV